jgi:hypothetical protein
MRVALIAAGQPRFTPDFLTLLSQLKGFEHGDLYFGFWSSPWAASEEEATKKISRIIPSNYSIQKIKISEQPPYELPKHSLKHLPPNPENIHWHFKRRLGLWQSLQMTFNLIDKEYDAIIRYRPDGCLEEDLDISTLDLKNNDLIFPCTNRHGFDDFKVCDLFAVGTYQGIKFYCDLADHFKDLVPIADPFWEYKGHGTWSSEHVFGLYMKKYGRQQILGNFKFNINNFGRSKYTDKHYHHPIVKDPTEL